MPKTTDILFIADTHVGNLTSPWPKDFVYQREGLRYDIHQNEYAIAMKSKWDEMCSREYDGLVLMGDLVDGPNRKDSGLGLYTPDVTAQAEAAKRLLRQVRCPRTRRKIIKGSNYHTLDNLTAEQYIGQGLGIPIDSIFKEDIIEVENAGRTWSIQCAHEITTSRSTWQYRATPVAREMLLAAMNRPELGPIDGIVRAHVHHYVEVRYGHSFGFTCPCWKVRDEYLAKGGLATIPRLGWVVVEFDGVKDRVTIDPHIFVSKEPVIHRSKWGS